MQIQYTGEMGTLQLSGVKFLKDAVYQKTPSKSDVFDRVIQKIKRVSFFGGRSIDMITISIRVCQCS